MAAVVLGWLVLPILVGDLAQYFSRRSTSAIHRAGQVIAAILLFFVVLVVTTALLPASDSRTIKDIPPFDSFGGQKANVGKDDNNCERRKGCIHTYMHACMRAYQIHDSNDNKKAGTYDCFWCKIECK
jgi:hypothetical protein